MKKYDALPEQPEIEPKHVDNPNKVIEASKSVFPPEYVEPLRGLLFLGAVEEEFEYAGHTFLMRTLKEGEVLRIGQLMKPYRDTVAELDAQRLFTVAASIVSVDGETLVEDYKEDYDLIYEKANVVKSWYHSVIVYLYAKYIDMERGAAEVANALKK